LQATREADADPIGVSDYEVGDHHPDVARGNAGGDGDSVPESEWYAESSAR
jgi:hypothetical protein